MNRHPHEQIASGVRAATITSFFALAGMVGCENPPPGCEPAACDRQYCDQVEIPAGEFTMGSDLAPEASDFWWAQESFLDFFAYGDERDQHPVSLDRYFIDKFEVTYQRYHECVRAGCCDPGGREWNSDETHVADPVSIDHYPADCYDPLVACPYLPVNCKSHGQAEQYCAWIGRRLCTEAEWERAAQGPGPQQREYPWGDEPVDGERTNVWIHDEQDVPSAEAEPLVPVNEYPLGATDEEVFGLAGGVLEWVADRYAPYPSTDGAPLNNPAGPDSGEHRVARGGCFHMSYFEARNSTRLVLNPAFDWG